MAKLNRRLYRGLNLEDGKDKELLKEYSPTMRDDAYNRGLEKYLREIEFNVGLAYGDLSDVQQVEKTAAEVKTSKARKFNRVGAIQNKLKDCLEDFVAGLAFLMDSTLRISIYVKAKANIRDINACTRLSERNCEIRVFRLAPVILRTPISL